MNSSDTMELLDGGKQAYPRMLRAISRSIQSVYMEMYSFSSSGVGRRFIDVLVRAARRGVRVHVLIDGWGSARGGRAVAAALREGGCSVEIHNRLFALLLGRFGRNHRKILLVDDEAAFIGGINIGDENVGRRGHVGWADLALEIHGPQCAHLGLMIRRQPYDAHDSSMRVFLCDLHGGWRLRRQYIRAFRGAQMRIDIAHGYFLPDPGVVNALTAAARRGVQVRLLLAGRSDIPFARTVTRSLHRRLLAAGVSIHEWNDSVLHAKVATIDSSRLLAGSFNLDPLSLTNLEALVEVDVPAVVEQAQAWILDHYAGAREVTLKNASARWHSRLMYPLARAAARLIGQSYPTR